MLLTVQRLLAFPHDRCLAVQFDDGIALFVGYFDEVLDRLRAIDCVLHHAPDVVLGLADRLILAVERGSDGVFFNDPSIVLVWKKNIGMDA